MTDDTDDFLFAQHVGLNSPDFIFAFWGSVAWVPLISFYFSGVQPHLGAPQGDEELQAISNQLLIQHQNSSFAGLKNCSCCFCRGALFRVFPLLFFSLVSGFFLPLLVVVGFLLSLVSLLQLPGSSSAFLLLRFRLNAHGSCSRASVPSSFG